MRTFRFFFTSVDGESREVDITDISPSSALRLFDQRFPVVREMTYVEIQ